MNLEQVYDELYGAIDQNQKDDNSLQTRVTNLETAATTLAGKVTDLEDTQIKSLVYVKEMTASAFIMDIPKAKLPDDYDYFLKFEAVSQDPSTMTVARANGYLKGTEADGYPQYLVLTGEAFVQQGQSPIVPATFVFEVSATDPDNITLSVEDDDDHFNVNGNILTLIISFFKPDDITPTPTSNSKRRKR